MTKILAIVDHMGWAYGVIAKNLARCLPQYEWRIILAGKIDKINEIQHEFDLVYSVGWFWPNKERRLASPREKTFATVQSERTFGMFNDSSWQEYINERYCGIGVSSPALYEMLAPHVKNLVLTMSGVDTEMFMPPHEQALGDRGVLGWAGRGNDAVFRGLPLIEEATADFAVGWDFVPQLFNDNPIAHVDMAQYYHSLDAYVVMSESEGGSLAMLEAAACGLPIISTDTGSARSLITDGETGYIVSRSADSLKEALLKMSRVECRRMGANMRDRVARGWTWEEKALSHDRLIRACLNGGRSDA